MCVDSLTTLQNFIENFTGFKNDDTITQLTLYLAFTTRPFIDLVMIRQPMHDMVYTFDKESIFREF